MKKSAYITIGAVLAYILQPVNAFAQNDFSYGFRIGAHMADIQLKDDDFSESYGNRTGPAIGVFMSYPLNAQFSVQPEVWYFQKGGGTEMEFSFFGEDFSFKSSLIFEYIEVPVLVRYAPQIQGRATPNLVAGPSFGFLAAAKSKLEIDNESETTNIKNNLKSTDLSLIFGGGLEFGLGFGNLAVDIRYMPGLSNILKTPIDDGFDDEFDDFDNDFGNGNGNGSIKNKGLTITLGLRF